MYNNFIELNSLELEQIDGGFSFKAICAGVIFAAAGVGCLAIAATPGVNIAVAAGVAYAGSWGISGGVVSTIYGVVA